MGQATGRTSAPLAAFGGLDQEDGLLPSSGIPHHEENPSASSSGKGPKLFLTSEGGGHGK